ncbi:MAG: hypothetical protein JXB49_10185 [Bacteroidales bacterium]|nr:hypothetical protein [Bacteroidales bacterium]
MVYSFQADSEMVNSVYSQDANYMIETAPNNPQEYCIIYFSSHNIYYPNVENTFEEQIIKKNRFEWFETRISYGCKHIFLRDIKKQWYLRGINKEINSPLCLLEWLKEKTMGYKIITVGSSAGGYASVVYGQLLGAEICISFNGQFELNSLLNTSNKLIDPIVFRESDNPDVRKLYDSLNIISDPYSIYYFYSNRSHSDIKQYEHVKSTGINIFKYETSNHGIPFPKVCLPYVLELSKNKFAMLNNTHNPILFSIQCVGFVNTILGIIKQIAAKNYR